MVKSTHTMDTMDCCVEHRYNTVGGTHPDWPCQCGCTRDCTRKAPRNEGGTPLSAEANMSMGADAYRAARAYAVNQHRLSPVIQERLVSAFMQGCIWLQEYELRQLEKKGLKHGKGSRKSRSRTTKVAK